MRFDRLFLASALVAGFAAAGCDDRSSVVPIIRTDMAGTADLSGTPPRDMAGAPGPDIAMVPPSTIADLYKNGVDRAPVTVMNAVITTQIHSTGPAKSSMICQYEAYAQDMGGSAPNGVRLYLRGKMCTATDAGACSCPFPPNTGIQMLDDLGDGKAIGDVYTITGSWGVYLPPATDAGASPAQHEINVATMKKTGTGMPVTPFAIAAADLGKFAQYGQGFVQYENTLITITPAMPAAVTAPDKYGNFTFGGAYFIGDYRFVYGNMNMFPAGGDKFTSITGIGTLPFGGGVAARQSSDFVK